MCSQVLSVLAFMLLSLADQAMDLSASGRGSAASPAPNPAPCAAFNLVLDSTDTTTGSGNIRVRNLNGAVGNLYLTFVTENPGAFPNDWFYGIALTGGEFAFQLLKPPPFSGFLIVGNTGGESTWEGTNVNWSLKTIYAVSLEFTPGGTFVQASPPVTYTIP